jgi:hypothetical protein
MTTREKNPTLRRLDTLLGEFYYVYSDARGVCRVYRMSLADGVWKIWRQSGPLARRRVLGA